MRTIYYFISAAVIALGLASCNKGESALSPEQPTDHLVTFVANTENSVDTKTSLSGNDKSGYQVLWREGDRIILDNGPSTRFYLLSGAGTTKGTFQGSYAMDEGSYDAYYTTASTIDWLSDETECVAGDIILTAPMKGTLTFEGGSVSSEAEFKNLCGLLRLSLKGEATVMKIRVYADQYLYGEFYVNEEGSAVINYKPEHDYITQYCREGVELASDKGADFYFPLPPNKYTGVKIEITDVFNNTCMKTLKADKTLNIARALITPVSLTISGLGKRSDVPTGALASVFTVNKDGRRVLFSRGNLYWDGDSFEFEENQNDYPKTWNNSHIGHFFWNQSASGTLSGGNYDMNHILFTNNPYCGELANLDFTVNGVKGKYRVLSFSEWSYLLDHHQKAFVTVEGVNGVVIAPDGASLTEGKDSYSKTELRNYNLVFLPATGYFDNLWSKRFVDSEQQGFYLSSEPNNNPSQAKAVWFSTVQGKLLNNGYPSVDWGCAIRLVTALNSDEPLDSSDIEKPEDGNNYDWE